MADPHNAISGLRVLKFNHVLAPDYDDVSFSFAHSHGEIPYPYINGVGHDWTGLDAISIRVRLYFLANRNLSFFPEMWERWWKLLQDGEPKPLQHPLIGTRDAVVRGGDVRVTSQTRAGVIAEVTFATTIKDPEETAEAKPLNLSVKALTEAAAGAIENAEVELPSEAAVTDLLDAGAQIDGFISQVDLAVDGIVAQTKALVGDIIDALEAPATAANQVAIDTCLQLWISLDDAGKKVGAKARPTGALLTKNPTTLDAFARERGNTIQEAMTLNPGALIAPTVPKNTLLRFYTA